MGPGPQAQGAHGPLHSTDNLRCKMYWAVGPVQYNSVLGPEGPVLLSNSYGPEAHNSYPSTQYVMLGLRPQHNNYLTVLGLRPSTDIKNQYSDTLSWASGPRIIITLQYWAVGPVQLSIRGHRPLIKNPVRR